MPVPSSLNLDSLRLSDVNCFDIWDRRECAVSNAGIFQEACVAYKSSPEFQAGIPHHLHQIWIGTRQPPCVWLDTWRLDFMHAFSEPQKPSQKPWKYTLWGNKKVRDMKMLNRELFDRESAPQCQADILRLELLYEYGGVYVDADIVSTVRDLRPALESAKETGFLITYEPDTKDKPYSILGNSLIACTPRHPLILMLMSYIKQVYPFKRAHYGVEWVTGPLTYTKVLMHTNMPVTVPPSSDFYPAFHYVPNPSAIDLTKVDAYCFQFGYTCSGLSQWVAENNRCRCAHECEYHANVEYPLGKLRQFPSTLPSLDAPHPIPKTVHQFYFGALDARPARWMDTWEKEFCPTNGFQYQLWTWDRLKNEIGSFFCANLYEFGKLDKLSVHMLALEVLHAKGGYYIPVSTPFIGNARDPDAVTRLFGFGADALHQCGSIIGYSPGIAVVKLKQCYDVGKVVDVVTRRAPKALVSDMGYGDEVASLAEYKNGSRYLGASEVHYVGSESGAEEMLVWAYDCQVPIFRYSEDDLVVSIKVSGKRSIVITDGQLGAYPRFIDEIPGVMYKLEEEGAEWDFIILNLEWEVEEDGLAVYQACCAARAPKAHYLGFIVNEGAGNMVESTNIDELLGRHESGRVYVATLKSKHSEKVSAMFAAMPKIAQAFRSLGAGEVRFDRDHEELMDNLFKGMRGGQIGFELQLNEENGTMFRSWGDDGSIDGECRISWGVKGVHVEFLRKYEGQTVVCDKQDVYIR